MHNVEVQTDQLIGEIKRSKEFSQYQRMLDEVKQNGALYERINDYRKRRFSMHMNAGGSSLEENDKFAEEYQDIMRNETAVEFLAAEQRYCKMIKKVNDQVLSCLDIDIDFLEG